MKFLVLALCVCAASAASTFGQPGFGYNPYKPSSPAAATYQAASQAANIAAAPFVTAARVVASAAAPVAAPVAQAAINTYQAAKQVTPYAKESEAVVLRSDSEVNSDGYKYTYETGNGIIAESVGVLKKVGEEAVLVSQGSYRYVDPNGNPVLVTYTADENGFQAKGDHLPVAPAVPVEILRSLEYIATHVKPEYQQY